MKITAIESRVIGYDVAEAWGEGVLPEGINTSWYEYSFDTFHTDEGVIGYTMQNANLRDGAAITDVLHDLYAPQVIGEDPIASEALWQKLRRLNRHAYNLSDGIAGAIDVAVWDIRGKVAGLPIASMLGPRPREDPGLCHGPQHRPDPRGRLQGGGRAQGAGLPRLQDPVLGRPRPRHPALPGRPRGGR